ncbi:unnamed protein product [Camellia sinensis]|uniref:SNRNP25 ubiquitin-like domain-containing protein n=1 Tax=Camellia sinensis TaxID=4442 RepID=A0A7J7G692_CAMSI|nr:uncharacterized protein LOC114307578 [Camellia sinensis]KAF5936229.1 hypothetical protein HYC85_027358 [Camellia sinensis]
MQILAYDDDSLPRVSFDSQNQRRRRQHRRGSSCCGVPISPHLRIGGGLSRKSFSYDELPQQPLNLAILKLDGSSFDVEIAKTARVAELKMAVEEVFSHRPRKGPGKISWSHVWGHFCLSYDGWKLLADSEPISNYGISDGDQLHFVRHVSVNYNLIRSRPPKDRLFALEQLKISDARLEGGQKDEKDDSSDDQENSPPQHYDDRNEDIMSSYESKLSQLFGRWFAYRRLGNPRRKVKGSSFSSRWTDDFLGSFRSIVRLYSSNKLKSQTDPSEEV